MPGWISPKAGILKKKPKEKNSRQDSAVKKMFGKKTAGSKKKIRPRSGGISPSDDMMEDMMSSMKG